MKKLNYLLSLFLLLFAGVGTIQAQLPDAYEVVGQGVTDIAPLAANGTKVALQGSAHNVRNHSTSYLSMPSSANGYSLTITAGNLYVFEATGETSDGNPTYYLKNDSTGLYLKDDAKTIIAAGTDDTEDAGIRISLTSNKAEAFKFTALHVRKGASASDPDYSDSETADQYDWVFAYPQKMVRGEESFSICFGAFWQNPFFSIYYDTNIWTVYEVQKAPVSDALSAAYSKLGAYTPNLYVVGNHPGNLTQALHDALKKANDDLMAATANSSLTLEEANRVYNAYKEAKEAADKARSENKPVAGKYYYIIGHDGNLGMSDNGSALALTSGFSRPSVENVENSIASYIWQLEDAGNGKVYLKNFSTGRYNGTNNGADNSVVTAEEPGDKLNVVLNLTASATANALAFNIVTPNGQGYNRLNGTRVCYWGGNNNDVGNFWHVYEVEQEIIDAIQSSVDKERVKALMRSLYSNATFVQHKGLKYNPASSNDGNFDNALVLADAAFSTNNYMEDNVASLLNDGNVETFYHSAWGGNQPVATEPIYIQVDLGTNAITDNFELKIAPRRNGDTVLPLRVNILTSANGTAWNDHGDYLLNYNIPATDAENALKLTRVAVGNSVPARYIRFVCKTNPSMQPISMSGGYASMCLSEFHVYNSGVTLNEDPSESYYFKVSEGVRAEFEKQLAAAQAELAADAATQETYDAFKAAFAALLNEMPDPQELLDAVAAARAEAEPLPAGSEIGWYDEAKKAELEEVLQNVSDSAEEGMDRDDIDAGKAQIAEALEAYKNSLILPTEGDVYLLRCATTMSANAAVSKALAYSNGNSETAHLLQMRQVENPDYDAEAGESETNPAKIDGVANPLSDLRYLWQVTLAKDGKLAIKNLATGYYLGNALGNVQALPNVKDAVAHEVKSSGMGGSFYLKTGKDNEGRDLYANFNGGAANLIGYNAPDGNSAFAFEPADITSVGVMSIEVPVSAAADGYAILTLPLNVYTPYDEDATVYEVLGQTEDGDGYALALKNYEDDYGVLHAGVPYLLQITEKTANADVLRFDVCTEDGQDLADDAILSFAHVVEPASSNALVGTISGIKQNDGPIVTFNNSGNVVVPTAAQLWDGVDVANNSGYVKYVQITETADAYITLPAEMSTGIAGNIVDANAKVDVYTLSGVKVRQSVKAGNATNGLPAGIYVVGGRKVLVK